MRIDDFERKGASAKDYRTEFFGPGAHKIVCMIGHIKPAKDYHLALDTAAALVRMAPEWRVLFVGESLSSPGSYKAGNDSDTSDYKQGIMEHYQQLGIADRVKFAGARSDAPAILKQCDVQLMTSCREGFPNVVLEGMVLGVPVVSTDYSDIRHILPRKKQVVGSRSPEDLAGAIIDAANERDAIVAEQKRWVRAHASIEKVAEELELVYQRYIRTHVRTIAA
jgi:glycosyltransferase involved in cell wall biosynthesis